MSNYVRFALFFALSIVFIACQNDEQESISTPPLGPTLTATAEATATTVAVATEPEPATVAPTATGVPAEMPASTATAEPAPAPTEEPTPAAEPVSAIQLATVVQGLSQPTYLTHAGDERLFVTEQEGRIQIVLEGEVLSSPFLDITDRVGANASEQGLLSVAFHPNYADNGYFFVNYTDNNGDTVISRFQVGEDPNQADPGSEMLVLGVDQPYANHNGGLLKFGPDGYLYVGMGDGGSGGDPQNNGQNPNTLLGALLRLDVDHGDDQAPYAIPPDNPYADGNGGRAEVWAIGLRNPWRFSFDRQTNEFYLADVGQNQYEEVHFVPAGEGAGVNYGWNIMEGLHCFRDENCNQEGLLLPVVEYSHAQGGCSITGGYVYRGRQFPALQGNYFFGDYCSGMIWSLFQTDDGRWQWSESPVATLDENVTSFGQDLNGELYVVTHQGFIYQIQP